MQVINMCGEEYYRLDKVYEFITLCNMNVCRISRAILFWEWLTVKMKKSVFLRVLCDIWLIFYKKARM